MSEPKRVMVVDDEAPVLFVLQHVLERLGNGYDIATVSDGFDALTHAKEDHYDLIITDLRMPGMGGMELTEKLRGVSPDTIVIWITAYGCHNVEQDAARLGVYRCLNKPLEVSEIREVVQEAFSSGNGHHGS